MLTELTWLFVLGIIFALFTAWGIGANDIANAFATSVGAKVLSMRQAVALAAVFEFGGASLMGSHVAQTIRKGIVHVEVFEDKPEELMLGMVAALVGASIWLFLATWYKVPVSTTHSIVGSVIGFTLVAVGASGVNWLQVGLIAGSWVVSPLLAGLVSMVFFIITRKYIMRQKDPLINGFKMLPYLYGFTIAINAFLTLYKGTPALGLKDTAIWIGLSISLAIGIATAILAQIFVVPYTRKAILKLNLDKDVEESEEEGQGEMMDVVPEEPKEEEPKEEAPVDPDAAGIPGLPDLVGVKVAKEEDTAAHRRRRRRRPGGSEYSRDGLKPGMNVPDMYGKKLERKESVMEMMAQEARKYSEEFDPRAERLFSVVQVLTAIFTAWAHGANDVANAIGPFGAVLTIYQTGKTLQESTIPFWVLVGGAFGFVIGLATWGYKIIITLGERLAMVTPCRGVSIELGSAVTVAIGSRFGIPLSTTHCKVGSVVFVGMADGSRAVNWQLMRNIAISWLVTLPVGGVIAALFFAALKSSL